MKYYTFDKESLTYTPVPHPLYNGRFLITYIAITALFGIFMFMLGVSRPEQPQQQPSEKEVQVLIEQADPFTEEKFIAYLKELNVKFPEIVYAQAKLESGNFQSELFKANNNMFGMKEAASRASTNHGSNMNYALYNHWREAVIDYALYQASYLSNLRSKEQYYAYLSQHYAQDSSYTVKVRKIADAIKA